MTKYICIWWMDADFWGIHLKLFTAGTGHMIQLKETDWLRFFVYKHYTMCFVCFDTK